MGDTRDQGSAGKGTDYAAQTAFPQLPGEDFLAHAGAQYLEQIDARLASMGLLAVAKHGEDPESCKSIVDLDLTMLPALAPTHRDYYL